MGLSAKSLPLFVPLKALRTTTKWFHFLWINKNNGQVLLCVWKVLAYKWCTKYIYFTVYWMRKGWFGKRSSVSLGHSTRTCSITATDTWHNQFAKRKSLELGPGELTQWLRALVDLPRDIHPISHHPYSSQVSVIPGPEDMMPSSGLMGHCTYVVNRCKGKTSPNIKQ